MTHRSDYRSLNVVELFFFRFFVESRCLYAVRCDVQVKVVAVVFRSFCGVRVHKPCFFIEG